MARLHFNAEQGTLMVLEYKGSKIGITSLYFPIVFRVILFGGTYFMRLDSYF